MNDPRPIKVEYSPCENDPYRMDYMIYIVNPRVTKVLCLTRKELELLVETAKHTLERTKPPIEVKEIFQP